MGNLCSCLNSQKISSNSKNMAKLIDSLGQLKSVNLPTAVADLMRENPSFALVSVEQLRRTRHIVAMKADERLLGRKVYLLVPFDMVKSWLSKAQLALIDEIVMSCYIDDMMGRKTRGGNSLDRLGLENLMKYLSSKSTGVTGQSKGWRPIVEPILEVC
ncbi:Hemagglutinin-neuraminidase [Bienertia sinuspersici]